MEFINLGLVAVLIALTGFFVAAEFAIVKVRSSRIEQLVAEKKSGALAAKQLISNLDEYLSACQLGITITALGLGWLGEPTVHHLLEPVFSKMSLSPRLASGISFVLAFGSITFLHVVIGELAPKTIAIQKAEQVSLLFAKPLIYFYKIMYPFIWVLNGSARVLIRLLGFHSAKEHDEAHSEEELRLILSESYESGEINQAEYKYVENIFEFDNRLAKEIMVPRTEIIGLYADDDLETQFAIINRERYTRYPVFGHDKDEVIGMVNVKDLFIHYINNGRGELGEMESYSRPIINVIETIQIQALLHEMQTKHIPMAILYDEYGGTAGMVTLEDILEEIVGEIRDEYDTDEVSPIQHLKSGATTVDGKVLLKEVSELFDLKMEHTDIDTIGGWVLSQQPSIEEGESLEVEDYTLTILSKDSNQIKTIQFQKNN